MTQQEFTTNGFRAGDKVKYKGKIYPIAYLDFEENLIGIDEQILGADEDTISMKRCENVQYIGYH